MSRRSRIIDAAFVAAALGVVALLVRRQVADRPPSVKARWIENWQELVDHGSIIGSSQAPVKIVQFVDFQCAACAYLHPQIRLLLADFRDDLAIVYLHYPTSPVSAQAAVAAECAGQQGRFETFAHELMESDRLLGVKAWTDFASDAEVADLAEFERCVREGDVLDRIRADIAIAEGLAIESVPSFLIDGTLISGLTRVALRERVRAALERHDVNR